jgi:hypothetical protein
MKEFVLISLHFISVDLNDATKRKKKYWYSTKTHKLISNFNM